MRDNGAMRTVRARRAKRSSTKRAAWRVGVDLGGTWIRVVALDARGRRRGIRRPAPGLDGLPAFLGRLWQRWALARDGVPSLVVASRGVWTSAERTRQARRLRSLARRVSVIADVEAAYLGALGERSGILLLSGTGSMALGRDERGRWTRAGGWGPLLGDEGSAFWIGREWLRETMATTGFLPARRMLRSRDPVAKIATLAPGVLRRAREGSARARRIVARGQGALANLLVEVARKRGLHAPVTVSWAGGLLADARFRDGVWRAARATGLRVEPRPPRANALAAVADLATRVGAAQAEARRTPPRSRQAQ